MSDPLAARLLATFIEELEEQVALLNAELLALEADPGEVERLRAVFRVFHTLKGAARAAGVSAVETACHALETLLAPLREGNATLEPEHFRLLFRAADALSEAATRLHAGEPLAGAAVAALPAAAQGAPPLRSGLLRAPAASASPAVAEGDGQARAPSAPTSLPAPPPSNEESAGGAPTVATLEPATPEEPVVAAAAQPEGQLRVAAHRLDALLASSEQVLFAATALQERSDEAEALHELVLQALRSVRAAGRGADGALATQLSELARGGIQLVRRLDADAHSVRVLARELGERVRRLRTRPFEEAVEALPRAVRDLADATGKEVGLEVERGSVEADRVVLDALREPLLQLVRNAVDHGIEPPAAREAAGKPRRGTIRVGADVRGDRLVVTVSDDGAGLDLPAIRARLSERGLPVPARDDALVRALFETGFSTSGEVTAISGRGVGLDIVRAALERLGGTAEVRWEAGQGTTFRLVTPLSLATVQVLLVACGEHLLAVPASAVERVLRVRSAELRSVEDRLILPSEDGPVALTTVARVLGPPFEEQPLSERQPVLLLRLGSRRVALACDAAVGEEEVLVRPLRRAAAATRALVGGTALIGGGRIALLLNPGALLATGLEPANGTPVSLPADAAAPPRILVVDDSVTTRTLEQTVLEAAGYRVSTAVDGQEAWQMLRSEGADLVVADIEMPRMDGFALTEAIRSSPRLRETPVILVTSLASPEHRTRGMEAGADRYVMKSSFDQTALLEMIRQLLDEGRA